MRILILIYILSAIPITALAQPSAIHLPFSIDLSIDTRDTIARALIETPDGHHTTNAQSLVNANNHIHFALDIMGALATFDGTIDDTIAVGLVVAQQNGEIVGRGDWTLHRTTISKTAATWRGSMAITPSQ